MPRFGNDTVLEDFKVGNFGFTGTNPAELGASGYTLADLVVDVSGSTNGFQKPMEEAIKGAIQALKDHPRADNMLVRFVTFSDKVSEVHGYKLLSELNPTDYEGSCVPGGMTALFDGIIAAAEAADNYGRVLAQKDFDVNGIMIVITDGLNNAGKYNASLFQSRYSPDKDTYDKHIQSVQKALRLPINSESLESYVTILIGVNCKELKASLLEFHNNVGFTQEFIALEDAEPKTIAKIGSFISESVSSTSQALGTGAPSQSLTF